MTTPADHDKRCPAAWDTSVKCDCGAADLPEALRSIQRFEVVDCIDEKHVPAVIPKPHGPWVRYEDHIAALAAGQATAALAQPAPENIRGILARCRDFIDTAKAPAYPAGADLADEIDVLLAAPQPSPPEGMVMAPKVPTVEMKAAAVKYANGTAVYKNVKAEVLRIEEDIYGEVYEAMIAAAPAPTDGESK